MNTDIQTCFPDKADSFERFVWEGYTLQTKRQFARVEQHRDGTLTFLWHSIDGWYIAERQEERAVLIAAVQRAEWPGWKYNDDYRTVEYRENDAGLTASDGSGDPIFARATTATMITEWNMDGSMRERLQVMGQAERLLVEFFTKLSETYGPFEFDQRVVRELGKKIAGAVVTGNAADLNLGFATIAFKDQNEQQYSGEQQASDERQEALDEQQASDYPERIYSVNARSNHPHGATDPALYGFANVVSVFGVLSDDLQRLDPGVIDFLGPHDSCIVRRVDGLPRPPEYYLRRQ